MKNSFRKNLIGLTITCSLVFAVAPWAHGQIDSAARAIESLKIRHNEVLQEKIFVHVDRSFYMTGEYLRFRIYCVDARSHVPLDLSRIVYVELLDQDHQAVASNKVAIRNGLGSGSFFVSTSVNSGNYTLRAYTRWMQNFSPEYYFHCAVTIVNPFRTPPDTPLQTAPRAYEANFFPEGGWMVNNLPGKVACKVTDPDGRGIQCKGRIINSQGIEVSSFTSLKFGIGSFEFTPKTGERYTATISDSTGSELLRRELPVPLDKGSVMRLTDKGSTISIQVLSTSTVDDMTLLAHTRGKVCFSQQKTLQDGRTLFVLDKSALDDGISHFTLLNRYGRPIAERLFLKVPGKSITVKPLIVTGSFAARTMVNLDLQFLDSARRMKNAEVSISVFRLDSLQKLPSWNIMTNLLLSSDLQGKIESPDFYFGTDAVATEAAANLMLSHGWRRFVWNDVIKRSPLQAQFIPEHLGHTIVGKVTRVDTGKPVPNVLTYLSVPARPFLFKGSRSDRSGIVRYEMTDFYGSNKLIIQTDTRIDSMNRIEIENPFSMRHGSFRTPPLELNPALESLLRSRSLGVQTENVFFEKQRAKVMLPHIDSTAFYNVADERYFLDKYTRFPTVEDVMREYVPGVFVRRQKDNFHFSVVDRDGKYSFSKDPLVLLDGVPIFNIDDIMRYDPLRIRKLEVVTRRYYYGNMTFDGIVSYSTYDYDLKGFELNRFANVMNYEGVQWDREYFQPRYDTPEQKASRLPDYRNLLAWIPGGKTDKNGAFHTAFYTSDGVGRFGIVVNALSPDGIPFSTSTTFEVTDKPK